MRGPDVEPARVAQRREPVAPHEAARVAWPKLARPRALAAIASLPGAILANAVLFRPVAGALAKPRYGLGWLACGLGLFRAAGGADALGL